MDSTGHKCCDPFKKTHTFRELYNVTESLIEIARNQGLTITHDQFICFSCRKQIYNAQTNPKRPKLSVDEPEQHSTDEPIASASSTQPDEMEVDLNEAIGPVTSSDSAEDTDSDENIEVLYIDIDKAKKSLNELLLALNLGAI